MHLVSFKASPLVMDIEISSFSARGFQIPGFPKAQRT